MADTCRVAATQAIVLLPTGAGKTLIAERLIQARAVRSRSAPLLPPSHGFNPPSALVLNLRFCAQHKAEGLRTRKRKAVFLAPTRSLVEQARRLLPRLRSHPQARLRCHCLLARRESPGAHQAPGAHGMPGAAT